MEVLVQAWAAAQPITNPAPCSHAKCHTLRHPMPAPSARQTTRTSAATPTSHNASASHPDCRDGMRQSGSR